MDSVTYLTHMREIGKVVALFSGGTFAIMSCV